MSITKLSSSWACQMSPFIALNFCCLGRYFIAEVGPLAFRKLCWISIQYPPKSGEWRPYSSCWTIGSPLSSLNSSDKDSCRQTETSTNKQRQTDEFTDRWNQRLTDVWLGSTQTKVSFMSTYSKVTCQFYTVSGWKVVPNKKCHNSFKTLSICLKF